MACPSCSAENDEDADSCFRCGKSLYALTEGAVLAGRYEILKTVGRGGMGIVYTAHDRELEEVVAVKLLRSETLRSKDALRRLKGEVRLARKIRHRNVSAIHELGQEGDLRFVVMEFVDGVDLKRVLRDRGRLPAHEALPLLIQAAAGLEAIHDAGIVHRDLKTPNIMLDRRGLVRLMDFGIAKQFDVESGTGGTATGSVVGTPEYMSPEQVRGEKLDTRSDIYALGIVVYELLTGTVPFKGDTPLATLFKQVQEPPPLEGERARYLPAPLIPVLRKMLEKDRDHRMSTAGDVILALEAVQAETSQHAPVGPRAHPPILLSAEAPEEQPEPSTATTPIAMAVPTRRRRLVAPLQHDLAPSAVDEDREAALPIGDTSLVGRSTPVSSPRIEGGSQNAEAAVPAKGWGPAATAATTIPRSVPAPRAPIPRAPSQAPIARGPQARSRLVPWLGGGILVAMAAAGVIGWWQSRANQPIPDAPAAVAQVETTGESASASRVPTPAPETEPLVVEEELPVRRSPATTIPPVVRPPVTLSALPVQPPPPQARPTPALRAASPAISSPDPKLPSASLPQPTVPPPPTTLAEVPLPVTAPAEPPPRAAPAAEGVLQLKLKQAADVFVDGEFVRDRTKSVWIYLPAGRHTLEIRHPKFEPLKRAFVLMAGQPVAIVVDLDDEAVKKQ